MHSSINRAYVILCTLGILLVGCSRETRTDASQPEPRTPALSVSGLMPAASSRPTKLILVKDVPHVTQKPDFCGEACAEMVLRKLGKKITQDDVFNASDLNPMLARGCYSRDLHKALRRIGFSVGRVFYEVSAAQADKEMAGQFNAMTADLEDGIPSIVCMHYDSKPVTTEHMRLVVGYDGAKDEVIYHEPAERNGANRRMSRSKFLSLWSLKYDRRKWTVIRFRMKPSRIATIEASKTFTNADYAQHIIKLKKKIPAGKGFNIAIEPPFVVIGDAPATRVRAYASGTVRWSVQRLKKAFFKKDPNDILDIWLFSNEKVYRKYAWEVFRDKPQTHFGYYSSSGKALIMNISTGGGTLVHEIVHPFVEANFPACPSWFNEGLGSLYEQSGTRFGKIVGLTNWRLAGLQKAVKAKRVPSFKTLTSTTTHQFYSEDKGTNYAHARYLCYYLQEKGLLRKYYKEFVANQKTDPTGYGTLKKILNLKTDAEMESFKKKWEAYVLKLVFR
ncbi:MAG: C39 family peptidase [Phycisphaerae bacterium]|nr:C39 family peptidase [Phycisphaerae bacterium]